MTLLLAAVVSTAVVATNFALLEEQAESSSAAHARVRAANNYDTTQGVERRARKGDKKEKGKNDDPPPGPPPKKKSKAGKNKGKKKSDSTSKSKKKRSKGSKKSRTSRPTLAPTPNIPSTPAPTSLVSSNTEVLVAAPPGKSKDEIEQELTAQVVATLGLKRRRERQLQQHLQQRKLEVEEIIVDGDTTTTIKTVATVIECQEIFIPPAQQPPNVATCYRTMITITINSSDPLNDSQLVVDGYRVELDTAVVEGTFTADLDYIVVEEGSTDLTGVPTTSPTTAPIAPTIAPVVPTPGMTVSRM